MSTLTEALRHTPLPLVHAPKRLGVMFSPKGGCTYAVKWFFRHTGLLEAATFYDPWVHAFRNRVFYQAKGYRPGAMLEADFPVVKLVRNPYERAVSSYLHAIRTSSFDEALGAFLGRPVDGTERFSFRELVAYLASVSLTDRRCDPHIKVQVHELERAGFTPTRVVKVEEAASVMPALEREWGLAETRYEALRSSGHHTSRQTDAEPCADRRVWPAEDGRQMARFPATRFFYDAALLEGVRRVYGADFEAYGYDPAATPA